MSTTTLKSGKRDTNRRILFVDDHEDMHTLLGAMLGKSGHHVMSVSNPLSALVLARNQDFDLVILVLPGILIGTIFGVLFNSVSPSWLVLLTIVIVLALVARGYQVNSLRGSDSRYECMMKEL